MDRISDASWSGSGTTATSKIAPRIRVRTRGAAKEGEGITARSLIKSGQVAVVNTIAHNSGVKNGRTTKKKALRNPSDSNASSQRIVER
jgi:hypothetical protein